MRCGRDGKWNNIILGCPRAEWQHLDFFLVPSPHSEVPEVQEGIGSQEHRTKPGDKLRQILASGTKAGRKNKRTMGKYSLLHEKSQIQRMGRREPPEFNFLLWTNRVFCSPETLFLWTPTLLYVQNGTGHGHYEAKNIKQLQILGLKH